MVGVFGTPPAWWLGGLVFAGVVLALRLVLNERIGVLGGYSELVERASGRSRTFGWKSFFLVGVAVASTCTRCSRSASASGWSARCSTRQPIGWELARPQSRHVAGSLLFGCGWAISTSCPGPIATQLATGLRWSGLTMLGIAGGILLYFARQDWQARSALAERAPADGIAELT